MRLVSFYSGNKSAVYPSCKILISAIFLMNSNIHTLFGQKTNYYQIKALDFVSCSYLLIIGLLTSFMDVFVH
jgi:uncharacterized membrane protein